MKYEFDIHNFSFRKAGHSLLRPLLHVAFIVLAGFVLTVVGYALVASLYDTRTEKKLIGMNRELKRQYENAVAGERHFSDALTGLQQKDALIYEDVFHSSAPNADPVGQLDYLFGSDTIPDHKLVSYVSRKGDELLARTELVERELLDIMDRITSEDFVLPPMTMPLKGLSYPQVGAGEGTKMNPFFRTEVRHRGLDLIVPQGEPVYAAADGMVTEASRTMKGQGRVVEIEHAGGYVTRYAHLSEIRAKKGTGVKKGDVIGYVGMTGNAVAPHLHYEIIRDSTCLNPIRYIFASVGPEEYANMLFMSANTNQSMD